MAHHLDPPIARQDVRLDITDLYLFRSETGTVFVTNVCHSIAGDIPTPGYHPEGMYEFKADLNGDAVEELTCRITFEERDPAGKQRFALRRLTGADAVDPHAPGTVVTQGITGQTATTAFGLRPWRYSSANETSTKKRWSVSSERFTPLFKVARLLIPFFTRMG